MSRLVDKWGFVTGVRCANCQVGRIFNEEVGTPAEDDQCGNCGCREMELEDETDDASAGLDLVLDANAVR